MTQITNYVDISKKSLIVAGIIFLIVTMVSKYLLETYNPTEEKNNYLTILYSICIALIFAVLSLVLFKQFYKFGASDISTEPFPHHNK